MTRIRLDTSIFDMLIYKEQEDMDYIINQKIEYLIHNRIREQIYWLVETEMSEVYNKMEGDVFDEIVNL